MSTPDHITTTTTAANTTTVSTPILRILLPLLLPLNVEAFTSLLLLFTITDVGALEWSGAGLVGKKRPYNRGRHPLLFILLVHFASDFLSVC